MITYIFARFSLMHSKTGQCPQVLTFIITRAYEALRGVRSTLYNVLFVA